MPKMATFRYDPETDSHDARIEVDVPRKTYNVVELRDALTKLIEQRPNLAELPVHLLDMNPEHEGPASGILTDLETDMWDPDEQGLVLSLTSWPTQS